MRKILPYNHKLKPLARQLRKQGILSEVILWHFLKNKQLHGFAFHRQRPIDNYIVDFYAPDLNLVIEIDGITHGEKILADRQRDAKLQSLGLSVLRFRDIMVKKDVDAVLRTINDWIIETHPGLRKLRPPLQGGEYFS